MFGIRISRCDQGPRAVLPFLHNTTCQGNSSSLREIPSCCWTKLPGITSFPGSQTMTPKQMPSPFSRVAQLLLETSHIRTALILISSPWQHSICARWSQSQTSPLLHVDPVLPQTEDQGSNHFPHVGRGTVTHQFSSCPILQLQTGSQFFNGLSYL